MFNNKVKAVISDLGGVIVNSFENFYNAYKQLLGEKGIKDFPAEYYRRFFGARGDYTMSSIEKDFNINLGNIDEFVKKKDEYYMENALKKTIPFNQTVEALKEISNSYKIAVASSSDAKIVEHSLKTVGLKECVNATVSGNEVKKGKPDPEIFIKALNKLEMKPENCLVIEDSIPGMISSYEAGIRCLCLIDDSVDEKKYDKALEIYKMSKITSDFLKKRIQEILN
jgi:HAD superfamily hydrolase (TIGR01509 family)